MKTLSCTPGAGPLFALLALLLWGTPALAGVSNVVLAEEAGRVTVTYDLEAPAPGKVRLVASGDGGKSYALTVEAVSGDVGAGVAPGKGKRIVWDSRRDYPQGLDDKDVTLDVLFEAAGPAAPAAVSGPRYHVIPLKGEVGREITAAFLKECLRTAEQREFDAVVLEIDSPGGFISELIDLLELAASWQKRNHGQRVAVFVDHQALSAAAVLSMAFPEIYMKPGTTIGAATAITVTAAGINPVQEKFASAYRAKARAAAEGGLHSPVLVEAMIEASTEVWLTEANGKKVVSAAKPASGDARQIDSNQKLLALTASEAFDCGLAAGVAEDYPDLGRKLGLAGWTEVEDSSRKLSERRSAEVRRAATDFEDLVSQVKEGLEKHRSATQFSGWSSQVWAVRKAVDELERLAEDYPFLRSDVARYFPAGTAALKAQCDDLLRKAR